MTQTMSHYPRMSVRMSESVVRRPNVPLTAQDEADLELLRSSAAHREALAALSPSASPVEQQLSEALLLHLVLAAGFEAIRRSVEEAGYRQLAVDYSAHEVERRTMARRRPPAWAQET